MCVEGPLAARVKGRSTLHVMQSTYWKSARGADGAAQPLRGHLPAAAHDPELHGRITRGLDGILESLDEQYDLLPETEKLMYTPTTSQIAI